MPVDSLARRIVVVLVLLSAVVVVAQAVSFLASGPLPDRTPGLGFNFVTFGLVFTIVLIPVSLAVVYRVLNSGMLDDF